MQYKFNIVYIFSLIILFSCNSNTENKKEKEQKDSLKYEENWESLAKNEKEPEWFKDAKLGIYFHWGVYSVPAFQNEWYPRWMYMKDKNGWGKGIFEHHAKNYGNQTEFHYHDFIPMFKAEKFDAADWADLFVEAGARFAGPVAQHHDGFAMWDSKINQWNAKDLGPKKDILGEIFKELKKRNLKTIATFHHARNLQRYAKDTANWGGWDSHFPYNPDYATSTTDEKLKYLYGNIPEKEFHDYWLEQIKEVVEGYSPDIIWFDAWLDKIPESYLKKMVALQFNNGLKNNQQTLVAYKQEDLPRNVGLLDMEQAGMTKISPDYWMTDITLSFASWSYIERQTYKPLGLLMRNMIDVWSKKGVVLLNICPKADGTINEEQRTVLKELGAWMNKNSEAIYGTRTHTTFGYGIAEIEEGFQGEGQSATQNYTANDIRFTKSKDGKTLYAFTLGLPKENSELALKYIFSDKEEKIKKVSILGSELEIKWEQKAEELILATPTKAEMDEVSTIFKIEFD